MPVDEDWFEAGLESPEPSGLYVGLAEQFWFWHGIQMLILTGRKRPKLSEPVLVTPCIRTDGLRHCSGSGRQGGELER